MHKDYLWVSERPGSTRRIGRLGPIAACLCLLCLLAGGAWIYAGGSAPASTVMMTHGNAGSAQSILLAPESTKIDVRPTSEDTRRQASVERPEIPTPQTVTFGTTALRLEPGKQLATIQATTDINDDVVSPARSDHSWLTITIREGDTLSTAFSRNDLDYADALAVAALPEYGKHFTNDLRPGDSFQLRANGHGHVLVLKQSLSPTRVLKIVARNDGYSGVIEQLELNKRVAYATGVIDESFYKDALQAGLTSRQVMQLADLFQWEVDFAYGIQPGDRFTVIYSELYKDGRKVANGHILAASFRTGDGLLRALRFTQYDNEIVYYRPDGSSLKRAFIRTPLDYTRISSPFTLAREHPILDTVRAHEGTDFAAPMGTPVHAAGSGRIVFRGRNGGYGNMIAIDHGRGITTRYGHMSRFAAGQSVGTYVEQGEIIGYVGSTGLSTGPHLHYEFRLNGNPKNPETVDLPGAPPLPDEYMNEFKAHIKPLIAQLKTVSATLLAKNGHVGLGR